MVYYYINYMHRVSGYVYYRYMHTSLFNVHEVTMPVRKSGFFDGDATIIKICVSGTLVSHTPLSWTRKFSPLCQQNNVQQYNVFFYLFEREPSSTLTASHHIVVVRHSFLLFICIHLHRCHKGTRCMRHPCRNFH